jgi:hypothetical protein
VAVTLLVVLTLLSAPPSDAPLREPDPEPPPHAAALPWQNFAVPVLENAFISFGLLAFSNLVTRESFALVSAKTVVQNLRLSSWTIDTDRYITNQFGHAYHGSFNFNAARSSGLSFWWASLYTLMTSLTWELFFESEPPSVNDQLTTPIAGPLLGEVLHRAALQLRGGNGPRWLSVLGAALLDPFGAINYELLGESTQTTTGDPLFMRWQFGATAHLLVEGGELQTPRTPTQGMVGVLLVSGVPWNQQSTYEAPLSYFDLRADLAFPVQLDANLFIRGLLAGQRFGAEGVWGLFGSYDYAAAPNVRASGVGLGPGVVFQARPFPGWFLQTAGVVAGSPFAAAGQFAVTPDFKRDYHVGVGLQATLDLRLIRPDVLQLELSARHWLVIGAWIPPNGFEAITWLTTTATIPLWRWLGLGAEFAVADRRARFEDVRDANDLALSARLFLSVMSEPHFGVAAQN